MRRILFGMAKIALWFNTAMYNDAIRHREWWNENAAEYSRKMQYWMNECAALEVEE